MQLYVASYVYTLYVCVYICMCMYALAFMHNYMYACIHRQRKRGGQGGHGPSEILRLSIGIQFLQ